ncbi:MAG: transposase, partial [Chloroflexota bacterium]
MGASTRPPYPPAFRAEAVPLVHANGRSLGQVAKDLGGHHETLRGWVKPDAIDGGRRDGLSTEERTELARRRRENRIVKEEREILRKAAALFAAERATRCAACGSSPRWTPTTRW